MTRLDFALLIRGLALAAWLGGPLAVPALIAAQGAGQVAGKVVEAETGNGLTGARVVVVGTARGAITGDNGRYLIVGVPAGPQTITVSYLGRSPLTHQVTIVAGNLVERDFALEVLTLSPIVVEGVRARGQAAALSQQQHAPNITNIVASDQMGRFPDASAPEAVQRLPGVAVERDLGEGRYIQIRGGAAQNTLVTFNGEQVPSPEGSVRQVALDAVPVDVLQSIEVAKAITSDMDAEAIGGAVNLVTRKAPDAPLLSLEAAGGFAGIRDDFSGSGSVTFGRRTAEGKLGYLVSGSYSRRNFGADDVEPEFDLGAPGPADDVLEELDVRHYTLWRARIGGTASLDYRLNERSSLFLTGVYSELQDSEQRRRLIHAVADSELVFRHKNRRENLQLFNLSAGGQHVLASGLGVDYRVAMSHGEEDTPYDIEVQFRQGGVAFDTDMSDPKHITATPRNNAVNSPYPFDNIEPAGSITQNRDYVATLNLSLPYRVGATASGTLKFGVKYRDKNKDRDVTEREFTLLADSADIVLGTDVGVPFSLAGYNLGSYVFPPNVTTEEEVKTFLSRFGSRLDGAQVLEDETNDYDLRERTAAAYVMTELNLTPNLMVLPGVRLEYTRFTGRGFDFNDTTQTLTPVNADNDYTRLFPALHLRYRLGPATNLRAAFTSAIARPNFFDLVPYRLRDAEDLQIGNADLRPTTSKNFDLLVEHYDRNIGVLSAGVFYKRLDDPIFPFVEDNAQGGETTQPKNGESGRILGFEVAAQQQLRFLPAPFDGLGVYANYTYTDAEATLPGGLTRRLAGQADEVFNVAMSYERGGFSGQISANYHAPFVREYGGGPGTEADVFVGRHLQFDLSASYFMRPDAQLFLEAVNLTNERFVFYQGRPDRPVQIEAYEPWVEFGLRIRR